MRFHALRDQWYEMVCCVPMCWEPLPHNPATPVCHKHGTEIGRVFYDVVDREHRLAREAHHEAREQKRPPEMRKGGREVVYYVRIGDYVKIGYTRRLQERIRQLRASFDDLLAVEDGDRALETQRHQEFRGLRLDRRRENFAPGEALIRHIEALGGRDSLPDWARRPDTQRLRISQSRASVSTEGVE